MDRSKEIIRTSWIGIITNVLLAGFKAAVGIVAGSVAVVMDAVNNLSDALSSVITIVGTKLSQRPADQKHPFGFGRIEYFSAIIIAVIVITAGVTSLIESVKKIFDPTDPEYTTTTLVVIAVAIVVKIVLGQFVKHKGEQLKSDALIASGSDALFDAIITLATLIAAGIMLISGLSLDGILGTLISIVIIKAGIEMLISPVNELLGTSIPEELTKQIIKEVSSFDGVHGVYDLILHNYGPDSHQGSAHIEVPDTLSADDMDKLIRNITLDVYKKHNILLTAIGVYSFNTSNPEAAAIRSRVSSIVMSHEHVLQMHGFYADTVEKTVRFDVVLSFDVDRREAIETLYGEVKALYPDYDVLIVPDVDVADI